MKGSYLVNVASLAPMGVLMAIWVAALVWLGHGDWASMPATWPWVTQGHAHAVMNSSHVDAATSSRPSTQARVLSCAPVPQVPGKTITTMLVTFPPHAYTPAHRHPGTVTALVLKGTVRSQMEGSPVQDYPQGASWFEPPRALHLFAENPSATQTAELMAVFVTDGNCGPLVIPEPALG
ncbi:cupin domain-containing protein [Dyella sp.]|uniref:cupin domain-containing protein n=1 Tax=Dyella sp. TaxID=1869338 RepID=UPI002ED36FEB